MNRYGVRRVLLGTLPGRAVVIGVAVRLAVYLVGLLLGRVPGFLSVIDTVAGLALAAGAAYFVYQLVVLAKRHLLWRVRRKLILSYVFVGFVPAALIRSSPSTEMPYAPSASSCLRASAMAAPWASVSSG